MSRTVKIRGRPAITVTGTEDVINAVKALMGAMDPKNVAKVLLEGARVIRSEAKRRAPRLNGLLKSAFKAKISKKNRKTSPSAWAAVDRKKAPHAHLVEFGTEHSAPHPYLRPAVEGTKDQVATVIKVGLARGVESVVRKRRRRKPK